MRAAMIASANTRAYVTDPRGAPTSRQMTPAPAISTIPRGAAKIIARSIPAVVVIAGRIAGIGQHGLLDRINSEDELARERRGDRLAGHATLMHAIRHAAGHVVENRAWRMLALQPVLVRHTSNENDRPAKTRRGRGHHCIFNHASTEIGHDIRGVRRVARHGE